MNGEVGFVSSQKGIAFSIFLLYTCLVQKFSAKGIVWDFDGTLLDSFMAKVTVLTEVCVRRGIAVPSEEKFLLYHYGHLRNTIQDLTGIDGDLLEEVYEDFIRTEERHYDEPTPMYFQDAVDLVRRAHFAGLKQIIVSNRPHFSDTRLGSPRNLAKRAPLAGMIDAVVCGDDNPFHKPDPRMLNAVERELGLKRTDLLVVGDQYVDAELAYNLGSQVVLVARDGKEIPHMDKLPEAWRKQVNVVSSLKDVAVAKAYARLLPKKS